MIRRAGASEPTHGQDTLPADLIAPLRVGDDASVIVLGDAAATLGSALASKRRRVVAVDPGVESTRDTPLAIAQTALVERVRAEPAAWIGQQHGEKADVVIVVGRGGSDLAHVITAAGEVVRRDGSLVVVLDQRQSDSAWDPIYEELQRIRFHLNERGFNSQRSFSHFQVTGRPSLVAADTFLQTDSATWSFSWLLGRAIGDSPPTHLNAIRVVSASRTAEALDRAHRKGFVWTTDLVTGTSTWQRSRQLMARESQWELQPLVAMEPAISGPLAASDTISPLPAGQNGEHLLAYLLVTSGIRDPEALGALRQWASAARAVLGGSVTGLIPYDIQPRNFVVGNGGWQFVDNGLAVRFPYPPDMFLLRAAFWLLVQRVLPHGVLAGSESGSVRHAADKLMRLIGGEATDVLVELWTHFEADLEIRTMILPRPRDAIVRELRALLERPAESLVAGGTLGNDVGPAHVEDAGVDADPPPGRTRFKVSAGWLSAHTPRIPTPLRLRGLVRNPLFNADWYNDQYGDVRDKHLNAYRHYRRHGWREGRDPNALFDTDWYLDRYPDVRSSGLNPLDHYFHFGAKEGRHPGPRFDAQAYLKRYPDVIVAGMNPLLHYIRHGATEGRDIAAVDQGKLPARNRTPVKAGDQMAAELERVLSTEYDIAVSRVVQRSGGEGSTAYQAVGVDASKWFIKVSSPSDPCWDVLDRDHALLASHELSTLVTSGTVVAPQLRSDGMPTSTVDDRVMAVFPYVELEALGGCATWSDTTMGEVARFVGDMHRASLSFPSYQARTHWPPDHSAKLETLLISLGGLGRDAAAGPRLAASMIRPHHDELIGLMREYALLRTQAQSMSHDRVLCHTDLNPLNLRRDSEGRLALIDCEDFTWAPAECDLYFLLDTRRFRVAVEAYKAARGPCNLRPELFELSYYADVLGLFSLILCRILTARAGPYEDARYVADLQRCIVGNLDGQFYDMLHPGMNAVREALSEP